VAPVKPVDSSTLLFASGRYRVKASLGEGAMKRVYLAHDTRLSRDVAIAVMKSTLLEGHDVALFRREAEAMGQLGDHPNVVTVHDVAEEAGQVYFVCEYMAGGDLERKLREREDHRLPVSDVLRIGRELSQALEYAHALGIVHRDVKPENVWLSADGTARLGDFGLALCLHRSRITQEATIVGTIAYMSPEQASGRPVDARSDLYSLGATLYAMVTGRPPFVGDVAAVVAQHLGVPPVTPAALNPEVPEPLGALLEQLLAKRPEDRPASAAEVRARLREIELALERHGPVATMQPAAKPRRPVPSWLATREQTAFVGRSGELARLVGVWERVLGGRRRLVLVEGEAGIGKTRLVTEFGRALHEEGAIVLCGRCAEENLVAYQPFVEALQHYVTVCPPYELLGQLGSRGGELARLVPELRQRVPGLPAPLGGDPDGQRYRLFEAVAGLLASATRTTPMLLVLEDVHWADKPTLLLLRHLMAAPDDAALLVVATFRETELDPAQPLGDALAELHRTQVVERLALRGLDEPGTGALVQAFVGDHVPPALARLVCAQTEGNPLFIVEVLRHLAETGVLFRRADRWTAQTSPEQIGIPEGVRQVIGRRLSRLSEACHQLLRIAAVAGRDFGLDVLERVCSLGEEQLMSALDEAVRMAVVVEVPGVIGRYSFAHTLVRETLYGELTAARRVRLHRRLGEALEGLAGPTIDEQLPQLAYHFTASAAIGDVEKAIAYATRAAERATRLLGYEEATSHYERALRALDLKKGDQREQRCQLLLALAAARWSAGETGTARETYVAAAAIARELGQTELLARAAVGAGGRATGLQIGILDEPLIELLEEGLRALDSTDSPLGTQLMARLAEALTFTAARERRVGLARQAVAAARRHGDPAVLARVLRHAHWALFEPENTEERLAISTEMVALATAAGDAETAFTGRAWRFVDLIEVGDIAEADQVLDAMTRTAEALRQPVYLYVTHLRRTMRLLLEGAFTEAEHLALQTPALGAQAQIETAGQVFGAQMFAVRMHQGRLAELEAPVQALVAQYPAVPGWRAVLAFLYSELDRREDARRELEQLAAHDFRDLPRDFARNVALTQLASVCAYLGDAERAALVHELLLPIASRHIVAAGTAPLGSASRPLGLCAATMRRWDDAVRHFELAVDMNRRVGARPWLAHTEYAYADMLLARGDPADRARARGLVASALEIARDRGMTGLVERAEALACRAELATARDAVAGMGARGGR
jgi:hypothetical protein